MKKVVLITGGCGYIGSHTAIDLINSGTEVVIVDDLSNSSVIVLDRIEQITSVRPKFYQVDILDKVALKKVFVENRIDSVIHFAAFKAVGESVAKPLNYYHNNVSGSLVLFEVMKEFNVKNIVFSSSATVYGEPNSVPINESFPLSATNPYGWTKLMMEQILRDLYISDNSWSIAILRYFNPVGAHKSGLIGEDPKGIPNNLMPYISQVAVGIREAVNVFGGDYSTHDGTGVRDYIHVLDLANGHVLALEYLYKNQGSLLVTNLGTGCGYSVLDVIKAYSKASNKEIKYIICDRRSGDIPASYANCDYAYKTIGFKAKYNLDDMCVDSWNWQSNNPNGYGE